MQKCQLTPTAKRRWFRFRLRTLFVVSTVICLWLGYELNWIRQRQEFVTQEEAKLGDRFWTEWQTHWKNEPEFAKRVQWPARPRATAPSLLWLFGERGQSIVMVAEEYQTAPHHAAVLSVENRAHVEEARRLFPEAYILTIGERFWKGDP